jgi:hypothetical protein
MFTVVIIFTENNRQNQLLQVSASKKIKTLLFWATTQYW